MQSTLSKEYTFVDLLEEETVNSVILGKMLRKYNLARPRQLAYWADYNWVTEENSGSGGQKRIYSQHEFRKIWFLAHLVNKVGMVPAHASGLADKIAKEADSDKDVIWLVYRGVTFGIPNVLKEAASASSRN